MDTDISCTYIDKISLKAFKNKKFTNSAQHKIKWSRLIWKNFIKTFWWDVNKIVGIYRQLKQLMLPAISYY